MTAQAERDAIRAREDGNDRYATYKEGWADGLFTFTEHIASGVKASCFPVGSCTCHPLLR